MKKVIILTLAVGLLFSLIYAGKIHEAANNGDLKTIQSLIKKNPDLIHSRCDMHQNTPLLYACYGGYLDVVKYLIEKGADIHIQNKHNNNAIIDAAQKGHSEIIELLLKHGADINSHGSYGLTPLHFATYNQYTATVKTLLKNNASVDALDDDNQTALMLAAWNGNPEVIKTLVEHNADINVKNSENYYPLHALVRSGKLEAVKILLDKNVEVNVKNNNGETPLHYAAQYGNEKIFSLLLPKVTNINQSENNYKRTVLHLAAINGCEAIVSQLLKAKPEVKQKDSNQKTALEYAIKYGQVNVVKAFINKGIASKNELKQCMDKSLVNKSLKEQESMVWYCGHSGWAVKTKDHLLIFDYWNNNRSPETPSLLNGTISPEEVSHENIYVFVSHDHEDHYDPIIFDWKKSIKNINYIYGFDPNKSERHNEKGYNGPEYIYIKSNKKKEVNDLQITTIKSNDSGAGFLVQVDGLTILHTGDHANVNFETQDEYLKEIKFLENNIDKLDIAFLPVSGCPARWKPEAIRDGFVKTINQLNPKVVFPMHGLDREYSYKEFAAFAKEKGCKAKILCAENKGDRFYIEDGKINMVKK